MGVVLARAVLWAVGSSTKSARHETASLAVLDHYGRFPSSRHTGRKNETPRGHSKYPRGVGGFRCPYPYPYPSVPLPTTPGGSLDPCPSLTRTRTEARVQTNEGQGDVDEAGAVWDEAGAWTMRAQRWAMCMK